MLASDAVDHKCVMYNIGLMCVGCHALLASSVCFSCDILDLVYSLGKFGMMLILRPVYCGVPVPYATETDLLPNIRMLPLIFNLRRILVYSSAGTRHAPAIDSTIAQY